MICVINTVLAQETWTIYGTVKDEEGKFLNDVNIKILNSNNGTATDTKGFYKLTVRKSENITLLFSKINYTSKKNILSKKAKSTELNITLKPKDTEIDEVKITDHRTTEKGLTNIQPKLLDKIPNISGNKIQTFIKTLPGVASVNEMSAGYSVRGGNFDENLVYINGIEIFRPMLLQSGRQEGLNMANPDLVSSIQFSAGGFSAKYDDKMSSVLDIKYKRPTEFKASSSISLLGASAHIEGIGFNNKLTYLTGFRYKNSQYLLNSLETKGEYKPNFLDAQANLNYKINDNFSIGILGYFANNNYLFLPEDKNTSFGTLNEALSLYIDFEGQEKDRFNSLMSAVNFEFRPNSISSFKLTVSGYDNRESLTYDIEGRYSLNQLDKSLNSSTFGDSILNIGIGSFIDHARSYFDAQILSVNHTGKIQLDNHFIQYGVKYQAEQMEDRVNEWKMVDSAGFATPRHNNTIELLERWNSKNSLQSNRYRAFIQSEYVNKGNVLWNIEYGVRANWWDANKELLVSPRLSVGYYVNDLKKLYLRLGGGVYYQSIFYREIIDREGNMHKDIRTPYSIQYTASIDYDFKIYNRPFHFKSELYYKDLRRLIPYSVDNIRLIYYPKHKAKGYVGGIDFRLNGEFVEGTDSWLSISLMKSGIDITDDAIGYQPLPNDHTVNISLFFQDYVPGNKRYKMYMALHYLSGLPFGAPNNDSYDAPLRMPAYKRVDIGFSAELKRENHISTYKFINVFKTITLNLEVFNLLGINNTISYNWVTVVPNSSIAGNNAYNSYAVPNRLSSRRLNLRLILSF